MNRNDCVLLLVGDFFYHRTIFGDERKDIGSEKNIFFFHIHQIMK